MKNNKKYQRPVFRLTVLVISLYAVQSSVYAMQALDDKSLSNVNGQDGLHVNLDFKESLIFFINFDSGFDRYGDVIVRSVCHCKTIDLLRYRISLPEPTYFLNS